MSRMVNSIFSAIRTVNYFFAKTAAITRLGRIFEEKRKANVRNEFYNTYVEMVNTFLGWVVQYGLIIGSYILVYYNQMNIGQATTMLLLLKYLSGPFFNITIYKNQIASTRDIRKRLKAILDEPEENITVSLPPSSIIMQNVSFNYEDNIEFMSNINLSFNKGKRCLIVGKSGSGKSTLLRLLLKELAPIDGTISYDGTDIAEFNRPTWYQNIAYAGQRIEVLPGTLRENIILDKPYDSERFIGIIALLNLDCLSEKLDEPLNEDVSNFSGGELQRVAIARMLYDDSPIFIFDEFSSALDNINARQIEEELLKIEDKLLISVTHRIQQDLLGSYDMVVIMENGKIKCAGAPTEMRKALEPYINGNAIPTRVV
jgi:ABC-type bacteriocin/lantibiotic exporter with double-glycine peptidase domain